MNASASWTERQLLERRRELEAERDVLARSARKLLDRAQTERRDLTLAERSEWRVALDELGEVSSELAQIRDYLIAADRRRAERLELERVEAGRRLLAARAAALAPKAAGPPVRDRWFR